MRRLVVELRHANPPTACKHGHQEPAAGTLPALCAMCLLRLLTIIPLVSVQTVRSWLRYAAESLSAGGGRGQGVATTEQGRANVERIRQHPAACCYSCMGHDWHQGLMSPH